MIRVSDSPYFLNFKHDYLLAEAETYSCGHRFNKRRAKPSTNQVIDVLCQAADALRYGKPEDDHHAWHVVEDLLQQFDNAEERHSHLTTCVIVDREYGRVMSSGHSLCAVEDVFCKQTGRWLSLTRAIDDMSLRLNMTETGREAFLSAYFNRPRTPKYYAYIRPNTMEALCGTPAVAERRAYNDWLRSTFIKHRHDCPNCGLPIKDDQRAVSVARALHDGTIAGDMEVLRTYHDACLV